MAWMTGRRAGWFVAAILAGGALLRLLYLRETAGQPDFAFPGADAGFHDYWARALATGNWQPPPGTADPRIGATAFFRPPGYPYFLSLVYRLTGGLYGAARLIQMALGLVSCWLGYRLGRRWFDAATGLVLAALMAGYWAFPYYEAQFLEPVLLVPLGLLLLDALGRWPEALRAGRGAAAGALLGLYAVVRPNILLLAPAVPLWAAWLAWRNRMAWRGWAAAVAAFGLGLAAALAPSAVRNFHVAHDLVLVSSNAGVNLYIGNYPGATGVFSEPPDLAPFGTCFDYPALVRRLEIRAGHPLRDSEVSRFFSRRAWEFMTDQPLAAARLAWRKTLLFWGPREIGNNKEDHFERAFSPLLRRLPGNFSACLTLAAGGLLLFAARRPLGRAAGGALGATWDPPHAAQRLGILLLFVGMNFISYLPFFVAGRYRVALIPMLLLPGAWGLTALARLLAAGRRRTVGAALLVGLALYFAVSRNYAGYQPQLADWLYYQAAAWRLQGRMDRAVELFREAARQRPAHARTRKSLGLALLHQDALPEAAHHLAVAVEMQPDDVDALVNFGVTLARLGYADNAMEQFRIAATLDPGCFEAFFNWGLALARQQQWDEARQKFQIALRLRPGNPAVQKALAGVQHEAAGAHPPAPAP